MNKVRLHEKDESVKKYTHVTVVCCNHKQHASTGQADCTVL